MKRKLLFAAVVFLSNLSLSQIQPEFVKNVNSPGNFIELNGDVFFTGGYADMGLWTTDGSTNGTVQIMAFNYIRDLFKFNNTLYFRADDGVHGVELWKSDGTTVGTQMVKDVNPTGDMMGSFDIWMNVVGTNEFYFTAHDGVHGAELWKSDGTEVGTVLVKDINPGAASSEPQWGYFFNSELYFDAEEPSVSRELFKSDGTELGTGLVMDLYVEASSNCGCPNTFFEWNNELYFTSNTTASTAYQKGIFKITTSSSTPQLIHEPRTRPNFFYPYLNSLYFTSGVNSTTDWELFKTDGTTLGTVMVDINPNGRSNPYDFFTFNSMLYFTGEYDTGLIGIMKSDGTELGTSLVKSGVTGLSYFVLDGILHFSGMDLSNSENEIWKTDGTAVGTVMAYDINVGSGTASIWKNIKQIGDIIYFGVNGGPQQGLWKFDLASLGTVTNELSTIQLYPNPANNLLTISSSENATAVLSSANGLVVETIQLNGETTIDVSSYAPGVYFIRTAEGQTVKFIKE